MSFGPSRKSTVPSRPTRPSVVKKPISKTVTRNEAAAPKQAVIKPKGSTGTAGSATKKVLPAAPKPTPLKPTPPKLTPPKPTPPKPSPPKPLTPEPVYDYESDFESDQSVPPSPERLSSTESSAENTESNSSSSSSEGGDDEEEEEGEEEKIASTPQERETISLVEVKVKPAITPATVRSVDILSKISLNDITLPLYQFDPEEYAELRTNFGITGTVAYGKHTQTDCGVVSTASQTSAITVRNRSTCMHETFRTLYGKREEEDDWEDRLNGGEEEDDEVQNYSSLQNIERMFCTLNGALERRFSKVSTRVLPTRAGRNQSRSIVQLLRKAAPIVEALLESRSDRLMGSYTDDHANSSSQRRTKDVDIVRSFDAGKMCPEFEIKLVHDGGTAEKEGFVLEFWARGTYSRPLYRFLSWSTIVCVDYEFRKSMMVFGGTRDGTLQMWLGDAGRCHSEVLPPHQIVAPNVPRKHKLNCWEMVAIKVLPVPIIRDSSLDIGCENAFSQVFALFSTGIVVVWIVQVQKHGPASTDDILSAKLGPPEVTLVQSKVMDLSSRIGNRLPYDALRTFENLILHDHHQMVLSSNHAVVRLSHFVQSEYDPVLLIQPDPSHSIVNLKRMVQTYDTLFVLYSNKTVRVLKLCTEPGGRESAQARHRKHDDHPHLMLNVCTNKSCTIQSIVHEEAKRYGNTNGSGEGRADGGRGGGGGGAAIPKLVERGEKGDGEVSVKPRFHHGQQILFFDAQHPDGMLKDVSYRERRLV